MPSKIVILTEGHTNPLTAKTGTSVIRYRGDEVVAVLDSTQAGRTCQSLLGVGGETPVVATLEEVPQADTLLIGIAPQGGKMPAEWRPVILDAIGREMTIISGLHDFLSSDTELAEAAQKHGVRLVDVRKNSERTVARGTGFNETCLRIHTIGNDCSLGKMVTAIELSRALTAAGLDSKFVATGQTGIMIEGDGCPIDCVVADFITGAAERLVLDAQHHEVIVVEGQGSLVHPCYSPVTLGLLHGTRPHGLILCYEAGRTAINGLPDVLIPPLATVRQAYETMAALMHPSQVIGIAVNSRNLLEDEAEAERDRVSRELGLPACDVFRHGPQPLVEAILKLKQELGK